MKFNRDYNSPFKKAFSNPKHGHAQANGQTTQTQNLIILERDTKKRT